MAQTEKGIVYPYDYNEVADVPADLKALAESIDALFNDYSLVTDSGNKIVLELNNSTYKIKVILKDKDDNVINTSNEIDLPIENMITNIAYNNQKLVLTYQNGQTTEVSIADLISGLASKDAVEELQSQIDDLTTLIETELDSNTVEGTEIDISDSAEYRSKIEVEGDTYQKQLSGKNLIYPTAELETVTSNGITFTPVYDEDGYLLYINANGIATSDTSYDFISTSNRLTLPAGTYLLNGCPNGSQTTYYINFSARNITLLTNYSGDSTMNLSSQDDMWLQIKVKEGTTLSNVQFKPMLRLSTITDDTYEPYCGGQPSPSTDYPQSKENVEGRSCRNLFDGEIELGSINPANGDLVDNSTRTRSKNFIKVKPNTTYTITRQSGAFRWIVGYTADKTGINDGTFQSQYPSGIIQFANGVAGGTFTTTATTEYIKWYDTVCTDLTEEVMLNKGSTALPYEEYFEGKRLEFNVCNKQLFDKNNANILNTAIDANGLGNNSPTTYRTVYIPCKPNTTYTVSKLFDQTKNRFTVAYTKETPNYRVQTYGTIYNSTGYTITITTGADAKYLVAYIWLNGGSTTPEDMINSIQIEEGTTATPYEEHKEQMIPFPLQEGQKLMEGDYLADDGVHHMRGQVVLDGSQDISKFNYNSALSTTDYNCFFFSDNSIKQASNDTDVFVIADKLLGTPASQRTSNKLNCWINHLAAHLLGIHVPNTITDTTELKTWLTNNPITFEYVLEKEVIEPYTEAQAEAYNQLMNLMLYKGVNHIWTETDGLEPNLKVTYKQSNNIKNKEQDERLDNLESRLALLE